MRLGNGHEENLSELHLLILVFFIHCNGLLYTVFRYCKQVGTWAMDCSIHSHRPRLGQHIFRFSFQGFRTRMVYLVYITCLRYTIPAWNPQNFVAPISRLSNQNGISLQWYIVQIYHSGPEPSILDHHSRLLEIIFQAGRKQAVCVLCIAWVMSCWSPAILDHHR